MSIYQEVSPFLPTYLYIKQHSITNKLYFGKTIQNPEKYPGSGKLWRRHIKKHGKKHVVTLWYELFIDLNEIQEFALSFSKDMNIIESDQWLNMIAENGIDGHSPGLQLTSEWKQNISKSLRGHIVTKSTRDKIGISNTGKIRSEEDKLHLSELLTGKKRGPHSKETIEKIRNGNIGKIISTETREKQRKSALNKPPITTETRIKLSISSTGRKQSKRTRDILNKAVAVVVSINGVIYDSISTASRTLGLSYAIVYNRIRSEKYILWFRVN